MDSIADDIFTIALEEIETIENQKIQAMGGELLEEWIDSNLDNFCEDVFKPRIANLPEDERELALHHMAQIKERIADTMAARGRLELSHRKSAAAMHREILKVYDLIEKEGRGVVYFGSARTKPGEKYYDQLLDLGREVSALLGSTAWTGAGPGQMEASLVGAKQAGVNVAGIKIQLDNKESTFEQEINPLLSEENCVKCEYFGPRKIGLVDAAMRKTEEDRTAIIVTPGGIGTLDEFFEFINIKSLEKDGSNIPVPVIVMSYDGFYDDLYAWLVQRCVAENTVSDFQLDTFHFVRSNEEALEILAEEYKIPEKERHYKRRDTAPPENVALRT